MAFPFPEGCLRTTNIVREMEVPFLVAAMLLCGAGNLACSRLLAQCHLVFPLTNTCINCCADPLVRGRPPRRLARAWPDADFLVPDCGTRASRAHQGGPPHKSCGIPTLGKLSGIEAFSRPDQQLEKSVKVGRIQDRPFTHGRLPIRRPPGN